MSSTLRRVFFGLVLVTVLPLIGCATAGPSVPLPKDKVVGSSWKLIAVGGHMDHRVVKFEIKNNSLQGTLIEKGRVLSQIVGVNEGMKMFSLTPLKSGSPNQWEGIYTTVMNDGRPLESLVTVEFFEDHFTWTLETATWSRVE